MKKAGNSRTGNLFREMKRRPVLLRWLLSSAILVLMQDDAKFRQTMQPVLDILEPQEDLSSSIGDLCPDLLKLRADLEE